jgi:hypothetical protein
VEEVEVDAGVVAVEEVDAGVVAVEGKVRILSWRS